MRHAFARPRVPALAAAALLAALAGCHHKRFTREAVTEKKDAPKLVSEIDLKSYKPNEAGAIMIIMYHRFPTAPNAKEGDMDRKPDHFRQDLEGLYKRGYRPVTISELVQDKMDVPAGKTPVAITFDDAWDTQFKIITGKDGQPHIDPNCAVGIIETFHKAHADWPTKATFFVLPKEGRNGEPFGQPETVGDKLDYLVSHGYEVDNHTSTHTSLRGMAADRVQWELGTAVKDIKAFNPQAQMNCVALPYGQMPRKEAEKYVIDGTGSGVKYHNLAVLMAAWRPVLSPVTKQSYHDPRGTFCVFNPYHLERIKPNAAQAKLPGTLEYYLAYFDKNPNQRYVSDGNPNVVAVPRAYESMVDKNRVAKYGLTLQIYPAAGAKSTGGAGSGSGLSVE